MKIILRSDKETVDFLKSKNYEEDEIPWKCPECDTSNYMRWFGRSTPCAGCEFVLPPGGKKGLIEEIRDLEYRIREIKWEIDTLELEESGINERIRIFKKLIEND